MGKRLSANDKDEILAARRIGMKTAEIAAQTGWSESAVNVVLRIEGVTECQEFDPTYEDLTEWCRQHEGDLRREHPNMEGMRA